MAAGAENTCVRQDWLDRRGIFSVLRQRTMTSLAIDGRVFAGLFHIENVGMAGFTSRMPGVHNRQSRDFGQRIRSIVTKLPEARRNKPSADTQEEDHSDQEDPDDPQQVL
jgi:hypothetical protein